MKTLESTYGHHHPDHQSSVGNAFSRTKTVVERTPLTQSELLRHRRFAAEGSRSPIPGQPKLAASRATLKQVLQAAALSFFKCGAFQTIEVPFARRRLVKNMLRHFQRSYRLSDQEPTIGDDLIQRLPHDSDSRCIVFMFQISHSRGPSRCRLLAFFCKGMMN